MLRFVTGKTGGGKSLCGVAEIISELRRTNRPIVTNFALRMHPWVRGPKAYRGLLQTLQLWYGETFDAERRIYFLEPSQIGNFYRCRPSVPADPSDPVQILWVPETHDGLFTFDSRQFASVAFFIDEAHEYFAQKDWAEVGKSTMSWASQNRRAGDDAWLFTQEAELVAKPLRRQSLECWWMINHKYKQFGKFRQPDVISYRIFTTTPPRDSDPPLTKGRLEYPRSSLWECYDTASGAGVSGSVADIGARVRGLHWAWMLAIAVVVVCICAFSFTLVSRIVNTALRGKSAPIQVVVTNTNAVQVKTEVAQRRMVPPLHVSVPEIRHREVDLTPGVVGWASGPNGYAVTYSDGFIGRATNILEVGRGVYVDGVLTRLGRPEKRDSK